jgi:hypothetical protein
MTSDDGSADGAVAEQPLTPRYAERQNKGGFGQLLESPTALASGSVGAGAGAGATHVDESAAIAEALLAERYSNGGTAVDGYDSFVAPATPEPAEHPEDAQHGAEPLSSSPLLPSAQSTGGAAPRGSIGAREAFEAFDTTLAFAGMNGLELFEKLQEHSAEDVDMVRALAQRKAPRSTRLHVRPGWTVRDPLHPPHTPVLISPLPLRSSHRCGCAARPCLARRWL